MRRFVSLLLVPLMLANPALCLAHTHPEAEAAAPKDHASRPHFHFGHHAHHDTTYVHDHHADHSHARQLGPNHWSVDHDGSLPSALAPVGDHDADAVYCGEAVALAREGNQLIVPSAKDARVAAVLRVADRGDEELLRLGPSRGQPPSVFDTGCPLYLRVLSLRI